MATIADSTAINRDSALPQHQSAITVLRNCLKDNAIEEFYWLDLACGRGQILTGLNESLDTSKLNILSYTGIDSNTSYLQEAARETKHLKLKSLDFDLGDLDNLKGIFAEGDQYDFITLTNIAHELYPFQLPSLIAKSLEHLSESGLLFVYDMEEIQPPELGAIPWKKEEIKKIVSSVVKKCHDGDYCSDVARIPHGSCNAWNLQLCRNELSVTNHELKDLLLEAEDETFLLVEELLRTKLKICEDLLESLTIDGSSSGEEAEDRISNLYLHWSLSRALKRSER